MATTSTRASELATTSWLITYISMLWIVLTRGTRSLVKQVTLEFIPKEYSRLFRDFRGRYLDFEKARLTLSDK